MNRWPTYAKYKPSGIDWLGDIPEHWQISKVGYSFDVKLGKMLQPEPLNDNDEIVKYFKAIDVQWESVDVNSVHEMWCSPIDKSKFLVQNGDLLICEGGEVGRAGVVKNLECQAIIQNALHRLRSNNNSVVFLMFLLEVAGSQGWFEILCNKATIAHFTYEKLNVMNIVLPPPVEQQAIADFLDRETGKIDDLIQKREKLIALLQEKRSALISHAVTKGLDPKVKLKSSGIDWLGDIPEHWGMSPLRYLLDEKLKYGANESAIDEDYTQPRFVRITDVAEDGALHPDTFKSLEMSIAKEYLLKSNDLLFARSGATVGKTFFYQSSWGVAAFAGYLIRARFSQKKIYPNFISFYTLSSFYFQWVASMTSQATIQNVGADKYATLTLPIPPLSEQQAIAEYLDRETGKIDSLIEKENELIKKMKEYRTALISAAVTGKIDVRGNTK